MSEFPPPALAAAAASLTTLLRSRNETISVAETAAGGLVSAALLAQPGASRIYKGGATLYTLESRIAFAGWTKADVDNYAGPNPELVEGLARHVRETLGSTYCIGEVCWPTFGSLWRHQCTCTDAALLERHSRTKCAEGSQKWKPVRTSLIFFFTRL